MLQRLLAGIVCLFCFGFAVEALAGEDAPAEPQKEECVQGYNHISTLVYRFVSQNLPVSPEPRENAEAYLDQCIQTAKSSSQSSRKDFLELLQGELDMLEEQKIATLQLRRQFQQNQDLVQQLENKVVEIDLLQFKLKTASRVLAKEGETNNWDKEFDFKFYLGYEGTSVAGLKEKGTARAGLMIYNQLNEPLSQVGGWTWKHPHLFGNVVLTSSAEESNQATPSGAEVEPALETDINLFYVLYVTAQNQKKMHMAVGPIGYGGLRKVDSDDEFTRKYYGGLRLAHSPESYFDLLYGKTEGIEGKRVELRGQLPVTKAFNGKLLIGGVANLGIDDNPENTDSLRLYVAWQVSVSDLLNF